MIPALTRRLLLAASLPATAQARPVLAMVNTVYPPFVNEPGGPAGEGLDVEIVGVDLLQRVAQEWYMFAELRLVVRLRATGEAISFNTAEFFVPGKDGRFIIRVGHGTDPAAMAG